MGGLLKEQTATFWSSNQLAHAAPGTTLFVARHSGQAGMERIANQTRTAKKVEPTGKKRMAAAEIAK